MELTTTKSRNYPFKGGFLFWVIALTIVLIATIIGAIAIGSTYIEPGVVYKVLLSKLSNGRLFSGDWNVMFESIIWQI